MFFLSRQALITTLTGCLSLLGVVSLQFPRMQTLLNSRKSASVEILERELNKEKLRLQFFKKIPTFGYDNLIASWVYLNFVQYFGSDDIRAKTGYTLSPEYFEVILERDPRFISAYLTLSTSTSMYAALPERAVKLMERGLENLSPLIPKNSYYVWRYKGIDELLFLGNSAAAQQSFENAASWAKVHSDDESKISASISQTTANFLKRNPNSKIAQISAWSMILNNRTDEQTKNRAIRQIESLGGEVIITPQGVSKIRFPNLD